MKTKLGKLNNVMLLSLGLMLSACSNNSSSSPKAGSIDSNGNCSSGVVSLYNEIIHDVKMYSMEPNKDYLKGIVNQCSALQEQIKNESCKAENSVTHEGLNISYQQLQAGCDAAKAELQAKSTESTSTNKDSNSSAVENCNSEVTYRTNYLISLISTLTKENVKQVSKDIVPACEEFQKALGDKKCIMNFFENTKKEISISTFKEYCDGAKEALKVKTRSQNNMNYIIQAWFPHPGTFVRCSSDPTEPCFRSVSETNEKENLGEML